MSIADSSKHMIQIIQLLEERNMIFSFCLNKCDMLIVCAMTLLYQAIDLNKESKLMREHEKLVNAVVKITARAKAPGSWNLKKIAGRLVTIDEPFTVQAVSLHDASMQAPSQRSSPSMGAARKAASTNGHYLEASASETDLHDKHDRMRRMTMPSGQGQRPEFFRSPSRQSFESPAADSPYKHGDHCMPAPRKLSSRQQTASSSLSPSRSQPNLDYLSLGSTPSQSRQPSPPRSQMQPPQSSMMGQQQQQRQQNGQARRGPRQVKVPDSVSGPEWEVLLGQMDGGLNNVYDAIYGGGQPFLGDADVSQLQGNEWSPDTWDLSNFNIGDLGPGPAAPQSVLSLSDESLSSGEDVAPSELGLSMGSVNYARSNGSDTSTGNGNGNNSNTLLTNNHNQYVMEPLNGFPL